MLMKRDIMIYLMHLLSTRVIIQMYETKGGGGGENRAATRRFFTASQNNQGFLQPLLCDKREKIEGVIMEERMKNQNK